MKWISVKKQLPPTKPILTTNGKEMHVAYINTDDDDDNWNTGAGERCYYCGGRPRCSTDQQDMCYYHFTHWMELPKLPLDRVDSVSED